jgi:hypothetical protein
MDVIHRYLDCGDLRCGFARIKCDFCRQVNMKILSYYPTVLF